MPPPCTTVEPQPDRVSYRFATKRYAPRPELWQVFKISVLNRVKLVLTLNPPLLVETIFGTFQENFVFSSFMPLTFLCCQPVSSLSSHNLLWSWNCKIILLILNFQTKTVLQKTSIVLFFGLSFISYPLEIILLLHC